MKKWLAILLFVIGLILLAVVVLCIIQGIWIYRLEYSTQIAEIGYYKEDIHILEYKYQLMQTLTSLGGVVGLIAGLIAGGIGVMGMIDNY